jgi:hypothetical protein
MISLPEQVVAVDAAFSQVPHAFGGAIALAYYAEPRATQDIDLNLFVGTDQLTTVEAVLATLGVTVSESARNTIERDGQCRIFWDETPLDLFFSYDPFHKDAARATRRVPFADTEIDVLSASHLVVCKALFDRDKDWIDINAMLADGANIDTAVVMRWVGRIAGDTDQRYARIAAVLSRR